jgi:hypothetical protein
MVHINAALKAFFGCARHMGINNTSGGIRKNELSANDTKANHHKAWRCEAKSKHNEYKFFNQLINISYLII